MRQQQLLREVSQKERELALENSKLKAKIKAFEELEAQQKRNLSLKEEALKMNFQFQKHQADARLQAENTELKMQVHAFEAREREREANFMLRAQMVETLARDR